MFDSEMSTHFDNSHKRHIFPNFNCYFNFPELLVADSKAASH